VNSDSNILQSFFQQVFCPICLKGTISGFLPTNSQKADIIVTPVDLAIANTLQCVHVSLHKHSTTGHHLHRGFQVQKSRQNCCWYRKAIPPTSAWGRCRLCGWRCCMWHTGHHQAVHWLGLGKLSSSPFPL